MLVRESTKELETLRAEENADQFITIDEAARLVGLSHWTIRKYIHEAKLQRYISGTRIVVSRAELLQLMEPRKAEPPKF